MVSEQKKFRMFKSDDNHWCHKITKCLSKDFYGENTEISVQQCDIAILCLVKHPTRLAKLMDKSRVPSTFWKTMY